MSDTQWPEPQQAPTHLGPIEYRDVGRGPALIFLHLGLAWLDHISSKVVMDGVLRQKKISPIS